MEFKKIFPYMCLFIVLGSQFITGVDLTHHLHNSKLYNEMFISGELKLYNPYLLSGNQLTFTYGLLSYPITGIAWFIFNIFSVDIIMILITIFDFIIIMKLLKGKEWIIGFIILGLLFHTFGDTYVAHVSNLFFWIGIYMFYSKIKFWQVPILLACINHPYALIASLFFILKDKKMILFLGIITLYFGLISYYFSNTSSIVLYLPFVFLVRTIILLYPILLNGDFFNELKKIKFLLPITSLIQKVLDFKISFVFFFVGLFICIIICAQIMMNVISLNDLNQDYSFILFGINSFNSDFLLDFPNITGKIRTVDYLWLPSLLYTSNNITYTEGSFRENNNIKLEFNSFYWEEEDYFNEIRSDNVDYVLFCKQCNPPTNELEILNNHFSLVWENEYYYLYGVELT